MVSGDTLQNGFQMAGKHFEFNKYFITLNDLPAVTCEEFTGSLLLQDFNVGVTFKPDDFIKTVFMLGFNLQVRHRLLLTLSGNDSVVIVH